ncbi:MAG: hypothetical protein LIP09_05480 [Bacteroidales bacterium]|nr:hypothetical protein [Bacteroidales bacterium]
MIQDNAEWAKMLSEKLPIFYYRIDEDKEAKEKIREFSEFVKNSSEGAIEVESDYYWVLIQKQPLEWQYIYDVLANAPQFNMVLDMELPDKFQKRFKKGEEQKITASYDADKESILMSAYTGNRREDLSGYDGFGREPDELEEIVALRDRNGDWVQEWHSQWV